MTRPTADKPQGVERARVRPRTDVFETPDALILVADVPGAEQDSIELALTEDVLTLRARSVVSTPAGWNPAGSEFELPDYERSFRLAADIDPDALSATLQNGRLRVVLKKRRARSNRIQVRAG
jgi:HSP20 family molecular chaperone IbpA